MSLAPPPRTVKPRKRKPKHFQVIAISNTGTLDENGNIGLAEDIQRDLITLPPTLFVKLNAADWVAQLDTHFGEHKQWQWRVSTGERDIIRPDGFKAASRITTIVHFFGFKNRNYHKVIDPVVMYGHNLDKIWPGDESRLVKLLQWGITLRDFCDKEGIEVRPTTGGMSSQMLTHPRIYPHPRRKVPMAINERVREQLPGNHYTLTLTPDPSNNLTAWYLDQGRAHHFHARTTELPNSNSLFAYGYFVNLDKIAFTEIPRGFYGLLCVDLEPPRVSTSFSWLTKTERVFVYTNELQHLFDDGYKLIGIRAAWGSRQRDTGLASYARWAEKRLDEYQDAAWLKPLLLSAYGTLATRPRYGEAVFKMARRGEPVTVVTGNNRLSGKRVRAPKKLEPRIANVLHRGMIEAACRSESVGYAQWLTGRGYRVLSIYADAVIVECDDDKDLPPLIDPWRCKRQLNHLQFINKQAFISGEMTKLPGVSQELKAYARNSTGYAPRKVQYEAVTGRPVKTNKRI